MLESLIALAKPYLTTLVLENEEVQKFPKDFVSASMRWIRSWFLEDDPTTQAVVQSAQPMVVKEAVLEVKLRELLKNPQFEEELRAQLAAFETHHPSRKNVLESHVRVETEEDIHIGDKAPGDTAAYDEKNIVGTGTTIKSGKGFRLGDG